MKYKLLLTIFSFSFLFVNLGFAQNNPYEYKTVEHRVIKKFKHVPQTQSNWCWAATIATVLNSYVNYEFSDCFIVNSFFDVNSCNSPSKYNQQNSLHEFDKIVSPFKLKSTVYGRISWAEIKSEISNGNPLIIRIESNLGQGHFIVIIGYEEGYFKDTGKKRYSLNVSDPMYGFFKGDSQLYGYGITWADLQNGKFIDYQANWTHTVKFSRVEQKD